MEAETYGVDPNVPLVAPALVPSIKVLIQKQALEATEEESTATAGNSIEIDFSKLFLEELYNIQQEAATKIRLRENTISSQAAKHQRNSKLHKALLQGKEREL